DDLRRGDGPLAIAERDLDRLRDSPAFRFDHQNAERTVFRGSRILDRLELAEVARELRALEGRIGKGLLDDLPVMDRARDGILIAELAGEFARRAYPEVRLKVRHTDFHGREIRELQPGLFAQAQGGVYGALRDVAARIFLEPPGVRDVPLTQARSRFADVDAL